MFYCKHCGTALPDGSLYCSNCGAKQVPAPQQVQPSKQEIPEELKEPGPGFGILVVSFFFPVVGYVMYFSKRKFQKDARSYLIAAIIGSLIFGSVRIAMKNLH